MAVNLARNLNTPTFIKMDIFSNKYESYLLITLVPLCYCSYYIYWLDMANNESSYSCIAMFFNKLKMMTTVSVLYNNGNSFEIKMKLSLMFYLFMLDYFF